jgi:hypothetical protein
VIVSLHARLRDCCIARLRYCCVIVALQGCVIVVMQGCVIVALQGCVIVVLQGCMIVELQGCIIVVLQDCVTVVLQGCVIFSLIGCVAWFCQFCSILYFKVWSVCRALHGIAYFIQKPGTSFIAQLSGDIHKDKDTISTEQFSHIIDIDPCHLQIVRTERIFSLVVVKRRCFEV